MKSFKEYLTEARLLGKVQTSVSKADIELMKQNKSRKVGETSLDINGKELSGSKIVSNGMKSLTIAYKDGQNYTLEVYNEISNTFAIILTQEEFNVLKSVR